MRVVLVGAELEENLALAYLRGALEAEGHEVSQVHFDEEAGLEPAAEQIAATGAELAGFSMVFTSRAREFARLVSRCRERGFDGLTLAGGHFAGFHAEPLLRDLPALDAVAVGEGERIVCDLARSPEDLARVAGLVWRDQGSVRRNPAAAPEQDLDRLPWPSRPRPFGAYLGLPIVNMIGSRGCTHACAFCSIAAWHELCGGARYRARAPEAIAEEMGCLWREGVRLFNFHDDNFLGSDRAQDLERVRALRDGLARQGVGKIAFQIKARPDAVDPELFGFLRSMGLFRVFLGIEAGTALSLKQLGRGQRLADNLRALQILNGLDLHVAYNLLVLNPDSSFEDFAGNVAFLQQHPRNPMNFCRTEVYAGTPLERRLRKQGRLRGDYWGLDYAISDERAQQAFEIFRVAFHQRNFGAQPLHYLSGRVDYEHQIRADLYGTTPELRASAKGFVRAVNENTVMHLQAIVVAIAEGRAGDGFASELAWRLAHDDLRLHAEGEAVLARIRSLSRPGANANKRSAAVAASVALLLASCSSNAPQPDVTQHYEAAPAPTCDRKTATWNFQEPYTVIPQATWLGPDGGPPRTDGPRLDAAPKADGPQPDLPATDATRRDSTSGAMVVHVTATIDARTWEPVAFSADPVLTGARLLAVPQRQGSGLIFDFAPDPGVLQVLAVIKISCNSIPEQIKLGFDVTTPSPGGNVPVTTLH